MGARAGRRYVGVGGAVVCVIALGVWVSSTASNARLPARKVSATVGIAVRGVGSTIAITRIAGQRVRSGSGETVRLRQLVAASGTVTRPAAHARIQLQGRLTGAWRSFLTAPVSGTHFTVHWRVRRRAFQLRAVLLSERHRLATSAVASVLVGPAIVRCRPAAAPATLPTGDGWIAGGVYLLGGPAPGLDQCQSAPSTITATSISGSVSATQRLIGGNGYALVLPAGTYALRDGGCTGRATVIAGHRTGADTICALL